MKNKDEYHPLSCLVLRQLGRVFNATGQIAEAHATWTECLNRQRQFFHITSENDNESLQMADTYFLAGLAYRKSNNLAKCVELYERGSALFERYIRFHPANCYEFSYFMYFPYIQAEYAVTKFQLFLSDNTRNISINAVKQAYSESNIILDRVSRLLNECFSGSDQVGNFVELCHVTYRQDLINLYEDELMAAASEASINSAIITTASG